MEIYTDSETSGTGSNTSVSVECLENERRPEPIEGVLDFIPFKIPVTNGHNQLPNHDISEFLRVSWILLMARYSGSSEISYTWGYLDVDEKCNAPASGSSFVSIGQILVHREQSVLSVLDVVRASGDLTRSTGYKSYMYLNNGSDFSEQSSQNGKTLNVCRAKTPEDPIRLMSKPSGLSK